MLRGFFARSVLLLSTSGSKPSFYPADIDAAKLNHPFWDQDFASPYDMGLDEMGPFGAEFGLGRGDMRNFIPEEDLVRLEEEDLKPRRRRTV